MTGDLVTRLRRWARRDAGAYSNNPSDNERTLLLDAANEIERLQGYDDGESKWGSAMERW